MAVFQSQGLTLAFDDIGPREARAMVLVHGYASNRHENWRRLGWYGAFERKKLRLIALDCRGHGESAKPHDPLLYIRTAMASDIFALLDHLRIGRADLLGYSMGARLALTAASAHPERFVTLILGGIGGRLFEPGTPGHPLAEAMEKSDPESIVDPLLWSFRNFADEQNEDRLALAACARAPGEPFARDDLAKVRLPTLVVAGARDALAGDPDVLAAAIPGARAVTLPGCDHFSAIPHALFKAAVFDFLEEGGP
jgi:pimeloyl-ACP methyl ester carboxylesterase